MLHAIVNSAGGICFEMYVPSFVCSFRVERTRTHDLEHSTHVVARVLDVCHDIAALLRVHASHTVAGTRQYFLRTWKSNSTCSRLL